MMHYLYQLPCQFLKFAFRQLLGIHGDPSCIITVDGFTSFIKCNMIAHKHDRSDQRRLNSST